MADSVFSFCLCKILNFATFLYSFFFEGGGIATELLFDADPDCALKMQLQLRLTALYGTVESFEEAEDPKVVDAAIHEIFRLNKQIEEMGK